jgi:hypothetical protein
MRLVKTCPLNRLVLPYCLRASPEGGYMLFNRDYQPLGAVFSFARKLQPRTAERMSWKGDPDTACVYFYGGGCRPWDSSEKMAHYVRRLEVLGRLQVRAYLGSPHATTSGACRRRHHPEGA